MINAIYCDHCGADITHAPKNWFDSCPWDTASTNAGESAVICNFCMICTFLLEEEEDLPLEQTGL